MSAGPGRALLAADSFRVRVLDGGAEVRGFARHLRRFRRTALAAWPAGAASAADAPARVRRFLAEAAAEIAGAGAGFPRLELWAGGDPDRPDPELRLSLRPLPELRDTIALVTAPPTPLEHPERKGPNLERLAALNRALGAEALLVDAGGWVTEGATTSLLWWPGRTGRVVASGARVDSVTERILRDAAPEALAPGRVARAELGAHEVWAVNALHGIRPVSSLDGRPLPAPDPARLSRFRRLLDRAWEPVRR